MIDMHDPFYCKDYVKNIKNQPQYADKIVDDHLKVLPHGPHPTTRDITASSDMLAYAMIQRGRFLDFFGMDRSLFPIDRLEDNSQLASEFPYLWLQHGTADTEVPIDGSRKFVDKLKTLNPEVAIRYSELEGMDHGIPSEVYLITSGEWNEGIGSINRILDSSN
jgi:hypothetical protein